jgi:hypothetical protein
MEIRTQPSALGIQPAFSPRSGLVLFQPASFPARMQKNLLPQVCTDEQILSPQVSLRRSSALSHRLGRFCKHRKHPFFSSKAAGSAAPSGLGLSATSPILGLGIMACRANSREEKRHNGTSALRVLAWGQLWLPSAATASQSYFGIGKLCRTNGTWRSRSGGGAALHTVLIRVIHGLRG